jgi:hypothetical protein
MKSLVRGIPALLLAAGIATGQSGDEELLRRAAIIKPLPEELKFQKIPWVLDLAEGQRIAQAEHRPIFLWAIADAPLERV